MTSMRLARHFLASLACPQDHQHPLPAYATGPPLPQLFERRRVGMPVGEKHPTAPMLIRSSDRPSSRPLGSFTLPPNPGGGLQLQLSVASLVSVTAADRPDYVFSFSIDCDDQGSSIDWPEISMPESIDARRRVVVAASTRWPLPAPLVYVDVIGPGQGSIDIVSNHSAIDVFGITGPLRISTSHGRVWLAGVDDAVVSATDGGRIVWSGTGGKLRLNADLGIDLLMADATFRGELEATASGSVRVVVPPGFRSLVRVAVGSPERFICRAPISCQIEHLSQSPRVVRGLGSTSSFVYLKSSEGAVTIDAPPSEAKSM